MIDNINKPMSPKRKAVKYLLYGVLLELLVLTAGLLAAVLVTALFYRGHCNGGQFLGDSTYLCSLPEYVGESFFIMLIIGLYYLWLPILFVMILLPLYGYLWGRNLEAEDFRVSTPALK
jgi:hypothetical protein